MRNQWLGIDENTYRIVAAVSGSVAVVALGAWAGARSVAGLVGISASRWIDRVRQRWWVGLLVAAVSAYLGLLWLTRESYLAWVPAWTLASLALLTAVGGLSIWLGRFTRTRSQSR